MDASQIFALVGWAAILSAVATIATAVSGILFFALGERFGAINDAFSVAQMALTIPVAAALYPMARSSSSGLALSAAALGILGAGVAAVLQALLVVRVVGFEQTIREVLAAGGAVGVWLILTNLLALGAEALPGGLVAFGLFAGAGSIISVAGFYLGGQQHPLFYGGALLGVTGYAVWAAWLGRLMLAGNIVAPG